MVTPALLPLGAESNSDLLSFIKERLSEIQVESLLNTGHEIVHVVSPLTLSDSRSSLETQLQDITGRYIGVINQFFGPLAYDIEQDADSAEKYREIGTRSYNFIYSAAYEKRDLLGKENYEQFVGAMESSEGFDEWLFKTIRQPVSHHSRTILLLVGKDAIFVQIIKAALTIILNNVVTDWRTESIPVLIETFDDYMTRIEDVFIEQGSPLDSSDETIPYSQVSESLGL